MKLFSLPFFWAPHCSLTFLTPLVWHRCGRNLSAITSEFHQTPGQYGMSDRMGRKANYDEWVEHIVSLNIGMTKEELIPFDKEELPNFVEDQNYHLDFQLSLKSPGFMRCLVVIEPSAKVKRKHCLIQETKMQKAIVNMLTAVFSPLLNLFKSEKDRPNNYVQLARGNGGEHE